MNEITPYVPSPAPAAVQPNGLQQVETVVLDFLGNHGLPTETLFVDVNERGKMLQNAPGVLQPLSTAQLAQSMYISKMIAAVAVGLFDAALNYLWDETVGHLRRRVEGFDLSYFFDIAATNPDVRKALKSAADLTKIDDANLLRSAREIGLITEVGYARLDHIRFMRNHASAAHPNQNELTGLDLANWLETCIRDVITTTPDTVTAQTGKLLSNLKKDRLSDAEVGQAAVFFDQLPQDRADTLANGLFGLYTDPKSTPIITDNVRNLWLDLWPFVGDDTRHSYGLRIARFQANADTDQAKSARELIDLVDGASYLLEETRAAELDAALDTLKSVHAGWNNFSLEYTPARQIQELVGVNAEVPTAVLPKYIKTLVDVFLTNTNGVSWSADPIYRDLIEGLDPASAGRALRLFLDESISSKLRYSLPRQQWAVLLDIIEPKLTSRRSRALMDAVRSFTGNPDQLRKDTAIVALAKAGSTTTTGPAQ